MNASLIPRLVFVGPGNEATVSPASFPVYGGVNDAAIHIHLLCMYLTIPPTVLLGEDIAFGGVFRCAVGLREKFGELFNL